MVIIFSQHIVLTTLSCCFHLWCFIVFETVIFVIYYQGSKWAPDLSEPGSQGDMDYKSQDGRVLRPCDINWNEREIHS